MAKLNGDAIAHKTERGLVRLGLADATAVRRAAGELLAAATPADGDVAVLVAPMVRGNRELIAGRAARRPVRPDRDARCRRRPRRGGGRRRVPSGARRRGHRPRDDRPAGHPAPARSRSAARRPSTASPWPTILVGLGRVAVERPDIESVDVNPLIVTADGMPIAVDALVELRAAAAAGAAAPLPPGAVGRAVPRPVRAAWRARRRRFVAPRQVRLRVAAQPARQRLPRAPCSAPTCRARRCSASAPSPTSTSCPTARSTSCSSARRRAANPALLRACAAKGVRAAFLTSAGYGEAGDEGPPSRGRAGGAGRRARHPARRAQRPGRRQHAGQAVRADRRAVPAGRAHRRRQPERQLRVELPELRPCDRRRDQPGGVGGQRRRGRRSPTTSTTTPTTTPTAVGLAYVEGISDGRALLDRLAGAAARKPLVLVKGGATEGGARAAASHTGALAADDKVFDGECRAAGITRAATVEEAFEAAATFATQPAPPGPNVVVLTTAGGWGVVTADAITRDRRPPAARPARRPARRRSTACCRRAGAATTRSTAPAARPATRSPT